MKSILVNLFRKVAGTNKIIREQDDLSQAVKEINENVQELLKAQLFNDAIKECPWVEYKRFSPTGWALNYNALYFLFNVLETLHPSDILEFGLGQSSKLIYQYVSHSPNVRAMTYEHDEEWVTFFKKSLPNTITPNIIHTELFKTTYKGEDTLSYKSNCEELKREKFDLILVDGPYGSEHYSRSQILNIVPDCLKEHFVIIIDDAQRNGESETISELLKTLDNHQIKYACRTITTNRSFFTVFSQDVRFITTI